MCFFDLLYKLSNCGFLISKWQGTANSWQGLGPAWPALSYATVWPDYGKLTILSHLLFQRIATDFKNLMVVYEA